MRPSDPAQHLKVVCRIRPSTDSTYCIFTMDTTNAVAVSPVPIPQSQISSQDLDSLSMYEFDQVISEGCRQGDVFEALVESYVRDLLTGRSAAIVLFGPTGSGKSYTVRGGEGKERGILLRAVEAFIYLSSKQRANYTLFAQAVLIYDEKSVELSYSDSPIKRVQDLVLLLQRALRARKEFCASQGDKNIKEKAHFLVALSVMRDGSALSRLDIVELAGSEQAADRSIAASFNALSGVLTRAGSVRENRVCSQLELTLDIYNNYNPSQVLFICTASPEKPLFKHSLAAIKFASLIRESMQQDRGREEFLTRELTSIEQEVDSAERPTSTTEIGRWISRREQRLAELEGSAGSETSSTALLQACSNVRKKLESLREQWLQGQSPSRVTPKFETMPIKFSRSSSAERLMSPTPVKTERVLEAGGQSHDSSYKESPVINRSQITDTSILNERNKSSSPLIHQPESRYDSSPRKLQDDKGNNSRLMSRIESLLLDIEALEEEKRTLENDKNAQNAKIRSMEQQLMRLEGKTRDGSRSPLDISHRNREENSSPRFAQSKVELQETKITIKKIQMQLLETQENLKKVGNEKSILEDEIENMKTKNEDLEAKIANLEHENSQLERLFDQMYHEKLDLERALKTANSSKQSLKNESKELQVQLSELQEDLVTVKNELQKAAENETLLLERNQDLEKDIKAADDLNHHLESKIEDLTSQVSSFSTTGTVKLLQDWMQSHVISHLSSIESKIEDNFIPLSQFEDLKDANSNLEQENTHLKVVNEGLSMDIKEKTQGNKDLKRQIKELEETIYSLKSQLITANTDKKQILDSQEELYRDKEAYRKELQALQQRVDEEKQTLEQKIRSIKREAENSADKNQEAKARLESLSLELTKSKLETMHYVIEKDQLTAKLEAVEKQNPGIENRARKVMEMIEKLGEVWRTRKSVELGEWAEERSEEEEEVEDLVFGQEERSDMDDKSLSGRLFHTSLSSSFG